MLRVSSSFFRFLIRSNIIKEKIAATEVHVAELFNMPTRKSDPSRKTIYPERKVPVVRIVDAFTSIALARNNI
jgi:hypothetical protein